MQFNLKVTLKSIDRKPSNAPFRVKNSQQKKVKATAKMQMLGKLGEVAIHSGDQKILKLSSEYNEVEKLRKEAAQNRILKQSDRSRAPPEHFGKSYSRVVQNTITKISSNLKTSEKLFIRKKKTNGLKQ